MGGSTVYRYEMFKHTLPSKRGRTDEIDEIENHGSNHLHDTMLDEDAR